MASISTHGDNGDSRQQECHATAILVGNEGAKLMAKDSKRSTLRRQTLPSRTATYRTTPRRNVLGGERLLAGSGDVSSKLVDEANVADDAACRGGQQDITTRASGQRTGNGTLVALHQYAHTAKETADGGTPECLGRLPAGEMQKLADSGSVRIGLLDVGIRVATRGSLIQKLRRVLVIASVSNGRCDGRSEGHCVDGLRDEGGKPPRPRLFALYEAHPHRGVWDRHATCTPRRIDGGERVESGVCVVP